MDPIRTTKALEAEACAAIRAAFSRGDPPSAEEMRNDHCPECRETNAIFAGKRWQEITARDLAGNPPVSALTAQGFRYYLPALMVLCIEATTELDCVPMGVLDSLSPPNHKPSGKLAEASRSFDDDQTRAVRAFLAVLAAREKLDAQPPEAFDSTPPTRVLARAIAFWSARE